MNKKFVYIVSGLILVCCSMHVLAQTGQTVESELLRNETEIRLFQFIDDLDKLTGKVDDNVVADELQEVRKRLNVIDIKWNTYFQIKQTEIAEDDELLNIVSDYHQARQALSDSIDFKVHRIEALESFDKAELLISTQDSVYKQLYTKALELSLSSSLAPLLETLKGKEQLRFADIKKNYEQAKNIVVELPSLQKRMDQLEECYVALKNYSDKIQAAEYKPWIQQIKDYLLGIAAVSIILMFINMVQAKIKMLKQARENANKFKQMTHGQNDDYPII